MKVKAIVIHAVLMLLASLSFAGCLGESGLSGIRKAGVLKVAVKTDVPKFGFLNTAENRYEGLEIDLARLIAHEIFGSADKIVFTPVTVKTRGPLLDTGKVDLIIATFTITEERKLAYNFSAGYYTDAVGMMVKKASGISRLADCDRKIIGVVQAATSRKAIQDAANKQDIRIAFSEFTSYPEIKAALDSGRVDIFSADKSILNGYLDGGTVILPDAFSPQEYGIASKLENRELALFIDDCMEKWQKDGTIAALVKKFGL